MQGGHAARLLKLDMNITICGTYLHTKLQNIDMVEHLHIKLWSESSISVSSYFLEYFKKTWPYYQPALKHFQRTRSKCTR
jgi:hypothetical protein